MTSHRRRSIKVRQGNERRGTEGRKRLDFDMSKQHLPLFNKSVYMDLKNRKQTESVEEQLRKLGAKIEKFLSREVNYVISTSCLNKTDDQQSKLENNHSSPTFGDVPSPFNCGPSPTGPVESKKTMVSRGKALAQIACSKNKASTVVANAEKLGIKVISIDVAHKWLDRELKKLEANSKKSTRPKKENKTIKAKPPKKENGSKSKTLKGCFVKFEANNQQYKPVKSEFDIWPKLNLSAPPGICPFGEAKLKVQHQYGPRKTAPCPIDKAKGPEAKMPEEKQLPAEPVAKTGVSQSAPAVPELVGVPIITTGDVKRNFQQRFKKNTLNKQQGYCDCCEIKFKDIDQHVNGEEHRAFARDKTKYASLDAVIDELPSAVKFLRSVLLRHCAQMQNDILSDRSCSLENPVMVLPPVIPLSTGKIDSPPLDVESVSLHIPQQCEPDILLSRDLLIATDTDIVSKKELTPTPEDNFCDSRPQAVVIRRPVPSGIFTSPRRRQPTTSEKPWVQERSMIFRDSPIASLQPSDCDSSKPVHNNHIVLHSKNWNLGDSQNIDVTDCSLNSKVEGEIHDSKRCTKSLISTNDQERENSINVDNIGSSSCKKEGELELFVGQQNSKTRQVPSDEYSSKTKTLHQLKGKSRSKDRYFLISRKKNHHHKKNEESSDCQKTHTKNTSLKVDYDASFSKEILLDDKRNEVISAVKEYENGSENQNEDDNQCEVSSTVNIMKEGYQDQVDVDKGKETQNENVENDTDLNQVVVPCIADRVKQRPRYAEQKREFEMKPEEIDMEENAAFRNVEVKNNIAPQDSCTRVKKKSSVSESEVDKHLPQAHEEIIDKEKERKCKLSTENDFVFASGTRLSNRTASPICSSAETPVEKRKSRISQDIAIGISCNDLNKMETNCVHICAKGQNPVNLETAIYISPSPGLSDIVSVRSELFMNKTKCQRHQDGQFQESNDSEVVIYTSNPNERQYQVNDQQERREGFKVNVGRGNNMQTVEGQSHESSNEPVTFIVKSEIEISGQANNQYSSVPMNKPESTAVCGQDEKNVNGENWNPSKMKGDEASQRLHQSKRTTGQTPMVRRRKSKQRDSSAVVIRRHEKHIFYPAVEASENKLRNHHDKMRKSMVKFPEKYDENQKLDTIELNTVISELPNGKPPDYESSGFSLGPKSKSFEAYETNPSENIANSVKRKSRFCKMFTHQGIYANSGEGDECVIAKLMGGSEVGSLVIPNIADRVKSRSRAKYDVGQTKEENRGQSEESQKRKKSPAALKCDSDNGIDGMSVLEMRQGVHDAAGAESSRAQSCVEINQHQTQSCSQVRPNIAESVKRRRSCTMFNHEGQYANNGEGEVLLSVASKIQHIDSNDCEARPTSRSSTKISMYIRCDQSGDKSREVELKHQRGLSEVAENAEGSPPINDGNSSDHSPAVVIRRKKSTVYPVFTGKVRPDVDWGKFRSVTDWTTPHDGTDDDEPEKGSKRNSSSQGVTTRVKEIFMRSSCMSSQKTENVDQMLSEKSYRNLDLALDRNEQSKNLTSFNPNDEEERGSLKIRKHRKCAKNCGYPHSSDMRTTVTPASPSCISNSPRLKLKIRRNSNDSYSSTVEELNDDLSSVIIQHGDNVQHTPKRRSQAKRSAWKKRSERHIAVELDLVPGSESVDLQCPSYPTSSEKRKEKSTSKTEAYSDLGTIEYLESSEQTPKSKKRLSSRRLNYGNDSLPKGLDIKCEVDENISSRGSLKTKCQKAHSPHSNRAQSPSFPSPIARKNLRSQTQKKKKILAKKLSRSASPVFKNYENGLNIFPNELDQIKSDKLSPLMLKNAGLEAKVMRNGCKKSPKSRVPHNQTKFSIHPEPAKGKRKSSTADLTSLSKEKRIKLDNGCNLASGMNLTSPLVSSQMPVDRFSETVKQGPSSNGIFAQVSRVNLDDSEWVTCKNNEVEGANYIASNGTSENGREGMMIGDSLSQGGTNELDELLTLVPTFSSPDKVTDSSWGDVCDSYLITSVRRSGLCSPHPSSPSKRLKWINQPLSPFKLPEHFSSPVKKKTPQKSVVSNNHLDSKTFKSETIEYISPNTERDADKSLCLSQQGYSTPVKKLPTQDLGFSPNIHQVDDEISFNFSSPQRLNDSPVVRVQPRIGSPLRKSLFSPKKTL